MAERGQASGAPSPAEAAGRDGGPASSPGRLYYVDWLRVGGMGLVFLFHSARFFDFWGWHVKNAGVSITLGLWTVMLLQIIMPLFFILSGVSTYYALGSRRGGFLGDRTRRLLVPLLFGILVLSPHQIYLERLTRGQFAGSFLEWLPSYFSGLYVGGDNPGNFAWMGVHLWYLEMLFLFSVLLLPPFRWLQGSRPQQALSRLAGWLARPGLMLLPALPLALAEYGTAVSPELRSLADMGGWNILVYLLLFAYGYALLPQPRWQEAARQQHRLSLALALVLMPAYVWLWIYAETGGHWASLAPALALLRAVNTWTWLLALLGMAVAHLSFGGDRLRTANEGVLPFYMLHQPVLLLVGFFIVQWDLPMLVKYVVVMACSLPIILGLYGLVVRRSGVLRFLFGLRPSSRPQVAGALYPAGGGSGR